MSRTKDAYIAALEEWTNAYGELAFQHEMRSREEEVNTVWELRDAEKDLALGLSDNVPEFIWF